jgi:acetate kinase
MRRKGRILTVNAGSSSVKLVLLDASDHVLGARTLAAPHARLDPAELGAALSDGLAEADLVAHRIVHGGARFRSAVAIDDDVTQELRTLADLAPLHQAKSLDALDAVSAALPGVSAVACFDTAFHATMPPAATTYALPRAWRERWGVRRYGFHGLSHAWVARRAPKMLGRKPSELRIVSAHLGAGASLCAIQGGRSVETTMGFTPLEGLVMGTRSGSVDPGLLLWLLERGEIGEQAMASELEHASGLLGLAGSADMRDVLAAAHDSDDGEEARLAIEVYVHRLVAAAAAMVAALGGLDALVFTGGVGEHQPEIRALTAEQLAFLGVDIDPALNAELSGEGDISMYGAGVRTVVVEAREDLEMARQARHVRP